jgi:hypothetical protein
MKSLARIMVVMGLLMSVVVAAHEGHDHAPVSMKKAVEIALATTNDYSVSPPPFGLQKLDESWRNLPESAARIHENGRGYYVVSVTNPNGKVLYVLISLDATVSGANFSGQFDLTSSSSAKGNVGGNPVTIKQGE